MSGRRIELDGIRFSVAPATAGGVRVESETGTSATLPRWSIGEHLALLGRTVRTDAEDVMLDDAAVGAALGPAWGLAPETVDALRPALLWWCATQGRAGAPAPDAPGWCSFGDRRVHLRPWSWQDRQEALADAHDGDSFDFVRYLGAMVGATVVATDPPCAAPALPADVLDVVVSINEVPASEADALRAGRGVGEPAAVETTLRLARALGWTPSQVWSTPAVEIDRLVALMDTETATVRAPRAESTLAAHADAVTIQIVGE